MALSHARGRIRATLAIAALTMLVVDQAEGQIGTSFDPDEGRCSIQVPEGQTAGVYITNTWPNGEVFYEFDENVTAENQERTLNAMAEIESVCNLQFILRTDQPNFIHIQDHPEFNNSFVGMVGGQQILNMNCWTCHYVIVHELYHALGVWHEQQRSDRNEYVQVDFGNIESGFAGNWTFPAGAINHGPYNFDSLMHYGRAAFSINGDWTMNVRPAYKRFWQRTIGLPTDHISLGDIWVLVHLYGGNPPPGPFELTAPVHGERVGESWTPTFAWDASELAESYRLLVDDDGGFGSPEIDVTVRTNSYKHGGVLAPNRLYYWTVFAGNAIGESAPFHFENLSFYTGAAVPEVLHVDDDAAIGGTGATWDDAIPSLQDALIMAEFSGPVSEIHVAQGVYKPDYGTGDRNHSFYLVSGVTLLGGYAGVNDPDPDLRDPKQFVTTLSGDLNGDDGPDFQNRAENSYCVVYSLAVDENAILDGFHVTAGNASSGLFGSSGGGGIFNDEGSPAIRNCVFTECSAQAGAVVNVYHGNMTMIDCLFVGNFADFGAGLTNFHVEEGSFINCTFTGNVANGDGGAVLNQASDALMMNCLMVGNTAPRGGALAHYTTSFAEIHNCTIGDNSGDDGGGVYLHTADASAFMHCILWDNQGGAFGGPDTPQITFSDIEGGYPGAGNLAADPLWAEGPSGAWTSGAIHDPQTAQTTFFADDAAWTPGGLVGMVLNPDLHQLLMSPIIDNTATTVTVWGDFAVLGAAGRLYEVHDYHLSAGSACIDAGNNQGVPHDEADLDNDGDTEELIPLALDGLPRLVDDPDVPDAGFGPGPVIDIGAYESQTRSCPVDITGDGVIDVQDLVAVILNWGEAGSADVNQDGVIDVQDLMQVVLNWGTCEMFESAACCFPDGDCLELFAAQCVGQGGAVQEPGTLCADTDCPIIGACCVPDATCIPAITLEECTGMSGFLFSVQTDCVNVSCEPHPACPGDGNCFEANGTPGCDDNLCCNSICHADLFCCDFMWDAFCAQEAADLCGGP